MDLSRKLQESTQTRRHIYHISMHLSMLLPISLWTGTCGTREHNKIKQATGFTFIGNSWTILTIPSPLEAKWKPSDKRILHHAEEKNKLQGYCIPVSREIENILLTRHNVLSPQWKCKKNNPSSLQLLHWQKQLTFRERSDSDIIAFSFTFIAPLFADSNTSHDKIGTYSVRVDSSWATAVMGTAGTSPDCTHQIQRWW